MLVEGRVVAAALFLAPLAALAQMGNPAPIVDSVTFSQAPVPSNSTTTITCAAHDNGNVVSMRLTVSGGTLPLGGTTQAVSLTTGPVVSGSLVWTTPAAGNFTVTCEVSDDGGAFGGSAVGSRAVPVTVQDVVGSPPIIDALRVEEPTVLLGSSVRLVAAAHDPDNDPLTFLWSAAAGSIVPAADTATWTAPQVGGTYALTLAVRDVNGLTATQAVTVRVTTDRYASALPGPVAAPRRVAVTPSGDFFVVDASNGGLVLLTSQGQLKHVFTLAEPAISVAACWGKLLVGTQSGRIVAFDPLGGQQTGELLGVGGASWPAGLACDPARGLLYVAERNANRVRAVWSDGSTAFAHTVAGSDALKAPVDVAVDPSSRRLWVLLGSYQEGSGLQVHAFTLDGLYATSLVPLGGGQGFLTRGGGLAVGPGGRLYVSDVFQARVQVFGVGGLSVGELGSFGTGPGQLQQPSGLVVTARGDLVVANTGAGKLELFGTGAALPACAGDADCDGLPDVWEAANGLNVNDARDAFADRDGDELTSLQEHAHSTNPRRADTDTDGYADGEEVAGGFNPLDPLDRRPTLLAQGGSSDPGMIELSSTIEGRGTCTASWRQTSGPAVQLREAATTSPWFVARAAGSYGLEGTPICNGLAGAPAAITVLVQQVPPRAEPGRVRTVAAGELLQLEGRGWDGNGDVLSLAWDQTLGPPRLQQTSSAAPWVRLYQPGLYVFALTADDGAGNAVVAEVPVLAVDPERPAPTAMVSTPLHGEVGTALTLDAQESTGTGPLRFAWTQTLGPGGTLSSAAVVQPIFTPAEPGHHQFELKVLSGEVASPPQRVDVYVSPPGTGLPIAAVQGLVSAPVGQPATLDGSASVALLGGPLGYRWRQVSGPAAGLTRAGEARARVVPFSSGTYVFELTVTEGDTESMPAWVKVEAAAPGLVLPVAAADAPAVATTGTEVLLDGGGSIGSGVLKFRWTQVAGPWVALTDGTERLASFTPRAPGLYSFELEVEDGPVRSAPTVVGILVFPATGNGGRP